MMKDMFVPLLFYSLFLNLSACAAIFRINHTSLRSYLCVAVGIVLLLSSDYAIVLGKFAGMSGMG